jgi:VIT1/CCC1 family predicted Fe2+/Mn2+ transporter
MTRPTAYLRNFIFGVEDSLVSTVGLLSGIAIAEMPRESIFLTGMILIFVEAFSMAAGSFASEVSVEEYEAKHEVPLATSFMSALVMFFSYFIFGFVPLFPYMVLPVADALWVSIGASLSVLFLIGVFGGNVSRINPLKSGVRLAAIGGAAILAGTLIGKFLSV